MLQSRSGASRRGELGPEKQKEFYLNLIAVDYVVSTRNSEARRAVQLDRHAAGAGRGREELREMATPRQRLRLAASHCS